MKKSSNKDQVQLREQIFELRLKIFESPMNKMFSLQNIQKGAQTISIDEIKVQDLKYYIGDLHILILKLSQYNEGHNQRENQLLYDVKTAIKLAEIMRLNLMLPLSPKEFTEIQAMQYRALLNIYLQNQSRISAKSPQKDSYYLSISQIDMYNTKLQDKVNQLQQKTTQLYTIQKLKQTNSFLQSQNEHLKKQNQLASARIVNYLSVKQLSEKQQLYINKQKYQLQLEKQQISKLIEENKQLKQRLYIYGESDRKASQQVKLIKDNFVGYFTKKRKNYQSQVI